MEQVTVYLRGERDYIHIRGATGPCVYPAGHLYLYSLIKRWTDNGTNIRHAQYIFAGFYVATQALVLYIYHATLICMIRSQIMSIEKKGTTSVLVNDDAASKKRHLGYWNVGCILFSLGVSVKMNVLLFAPGLLLLLLQVSKNLYHVIFRLFFFCGLPQLILGAPFLLHHPIHYLRKAFELDRSFFYQWTVNWKFLPEHIFLSKPLSISLLLLHIGTLVYFCIIWFQPISDGNTTTGKRLFLFSLSSGNSPVDSKKQHLSSIYITSTLLTSNFIGICFARTMHYQFYSWYFHALPFLLLYRHIPPSPYSQASLASSAQSMVPWWMIRAIVTLFAVEVAYLTFPATPVSSGLLQLAHFAILIQIRPPETVLAEGHPLNSKVD